MQGQRTDISYPIRELDVKNMNDMLMNLWQKVYGNLDLKDLNGNVKEQLFTYPIQVNGEGNLDSGNPLIVRFYVPSDVKKVKSASINAIVTNYRMDSDVAAAGGQSIALNGSIGLSSSGGTISSTLEVSEWQSNYDGTRATVPHPPLATRSIYDVENFAQLLDSVTGNPIWYFGKPLDPGYYSKLVTPIPVGATSWDSQLNADINSSGQYFAWLDLARIQHKHKFLLDWTHSHAADLSGTVAAHSHPLNEGIKVSSVFPNGIKIYVNNNPIGDMMNGSAPVQNNIDISQFVQVGGWNEIKITSYTVSRITIYGIIEVATKTY